jgi:hypothetical protein
LKASLNLGPLAGDLDTVVQARTPGTAGNEITVIVTGHATAGAGAYVTQSGNAVTLWYESGVTTIALLEAAITAAAATCVIEVLTPGTGATVLTAAGDDIASTALAGGTDVAVSGIFTVWGRMGMVWAIHHKMNAGSAVAGTDNHNHSEIVTGLGLYDRIYMQAATLTGNGGATIHEVIEKGD